ncbi:MAG: Asp-tRNA(Asn)/Glu-tRNA(Gln) amidotransferase subunit GatC [Patescibacteria group bacterium]|nr:Asp-tRNA(Asn)/Glu-tRNA(Gln) amidotransferase subunit GatC [Patescibacteria group bacterium]
MIERKQIEHLAHLARVNITENEIEGLTKDINEILEYVSKINELDILDKFDPFVSIIDNNFLREDRQTEDENLIEEILANFPQREDHYLRVPKILEK